MEIKKRRTNNTTVYDTENMRGKWRIGVAVIFIFLLLTFIFGS